MWIFNFYLNILCDQIKYILVDSNVKKNLSPLSVRSGWEQKLFCIRWGDEFSSELRAHAAMGGASMQVRWKSVVKARGPRGESQPSGSPLRATCPQGTSGTVWRYFYNFHDRGAESSSWLRMGRSLRKWQNQDGSVLPPSSLKQPMWHAPEEWRCSLEMQNWEPRNWHK